MAVKNLAPVEPNITLAAIGALVRDARKLKNLSQGELADRVRLNQKTISALENGAEGTEVRTILRVLGALGLKLDIGILGSEDPIYSSEDGKMKRAVKSYFVGPDKEEILGSLRRVSDRLKEAGVTSLVLFGSTARGEAGPKSDIDIGYEVGGAPDLFTIGKIEDILQELFSHKVDLVRLKNLRGDVRSSAEKDMIHVI